MQLSEELWVKVPEFPYEVSCLGRVRRLSIASEAMRKLFPRRNYEPRILTPTVNNGYQYVTLSTKTKQRRVSVHALILTVFVGDRPKGMYGCHKNGNRSDNRVENLKWATPKENQEDRVKHGNGQDGEANGSCKMTAEKVRLLRAARRTGLTYDQLSEMFRTTRGNVHVICTMQTWKNCS